MLTRCKQFVVLTSLSCCCLSQMCLGSNAIEVNKTTENKEILLGECIKSLEEICDQNLSIRQYLENAIDKIGIICRNQENRSE